jgi:hypothetical protein
MTPIDAPGSISPLIASVMQWALGILGAVAVALFGWVWTMNSRVIALEALTRVLSKDHEDTQKALQSVETKIDDIRREQVSKAFIESQVYMLTQRMDRFVDNHRSP